MSAAPRPGGVLVTGALGRMGERVRALLAQESELVLASALERPGHPALGTQLQAGVRLGDDVKAAVSACEVVVDFTTPEASLACLEAAGGDGVACVIGTTGFDAAQRDEIEALARRIPIVLAANFSVAVNVLFHLARRTAELLGDGYDAEIVELHHAAKVDAPSGTALRLAAAVAEGRGQATEGRLLTSRQGQTGARPAGAIGVQSLRGGDNPGEHSLYFVGAGERLELVHRAATRDHFARGAIGAAVWLRGRRPGLYDMEQVIGLAPVPGGGKSS